MDAPLPLEYSLDIQVRGWDCGYGGPLRVLPLLNFLQEAAGGSADLLGFGMDTMKEENRTWMLSRIDLRVERLPEAGDSVRVRTRPAGFDRLFALRDFMLVSATGETLARAVYAYLVVDLAARRPLRPDRALAGLRQGAPSTAVADRRFGAAEADPAAFRSAYPLRAAPRHIDENGHVNNAHIADWLADAVPREARGAGGRLRLLRVDFLQEALEGELLEAFWAPLPAAGGAPVAGGAEVAGGAAASTGTVATELRRGGEVVARAESGWA